MTAKEAKDSWTREQDKAFENAIADYPQGCISRWERIAAAVHGKTVEEIKHHYRNLEEDIAAIMAGLVPLPNYASESEVSNYQKGGNSLGAVHVGSSSKPNQQQRNRGVPWTEEEHRNFLRGLDEFGKGDWRSISRKHVKSRTPTQVASHAQKFFDRIENPAKRERRRTSIHDITTVGSGDQGPISGQTTRQSSPSGFGIANHTPVPVAHHMHHNTTVGSQDPTAEQGRPTQQSSHLPAGPSGFGIANHIPTIGTPAPVMLYGVQHPVSGMMIPGAPINMGSMAYQMPDLWLEDNWC